MSRALRTDKKAWANKVLLLLKGGNTAAALAQVKVAPTVQDLQQLQALLRSSPGVTPQVTTVVAEQIALLSAPRLHRAP